MAMQRAMDKTESMRARASAMDELEAAGAFDDNLSLTAGQDDIDRQLAELTSGSQVEDDLAKMKAELGQGSAPRRPLEEGAPAQEQQPRAASSDRPHRDGGPVPPARTPTPSASTSSTTRPWRRSRPTTRTGSMSLRGDAPARPHGRHKLGEDELESPT